MPTTLTIKNQGGMDGRTVQVSVKGEAHKETITLDRYEEHDFVVDDKYHLEVRELEDGSKGA